jgi:hypothetical protein
MNIRVNEYIAATENAAAQEEKFGAASVGSDLPAGRKEMAPQALEKMESAT